jgi:hypothetical protein
MIPPQVANVEIASASDLAAQFVRYHLKGKLDTDFILFCINKITVNCYADQIKKIEGVTQFDIEADGVPMCLYLLTSDAYDYAIQNFEEVRRCVGIVRESQSSLLVYCRGNETYYYLLRIIDECGDDEETPLLN